MEFCILPPLEHLEYAKLSKRHLCLAHISGHEYWDFYASRKRAGDHIILDNSTYEGKPNWTTLRNRIIGLGPNVVVLPDYIGQTWERTYFQAKHFLDDHHKMFPKTEWMYVPQAQANDIVGWSTGLTNALTDTRITWIGLPRALGYLYTADPYIRVKIAVNLKLERPDIKIHALGMVKGDVHELQMLNETSCVESIDSHWPFRGKPDEIMQRLEACGVYSTVVRERNNSQ